MKYTASLLLGLTMLPMAAFADTGTLSIQEHISLLQRLVAALQAELQAQLNLTAATSTPIIIEVPAKPVSTSAPVSCTRTPGAGWSCGG